MADMLVKLYDLPDSDNCLMKLSRSGITVRRAYAREKGLVLSWIEETFSAKWNSECSIAFSMHPISCFIAHRERSILGFACYECTCRNFFGPIGVNESERGKRIGEALLIKSLQAMKALGYAYAIIGGAGPEDFYKRTVGAVAIEGSTPGFYSDVMNH